MSLLFFVNAGPAWGLWRASRCAALAECARDLGLGSRFLVEGGAAPWVADLGLEARESDPVQPLARRDEIIDTARGAAALIVDAPVIDAVGLTRLRGALGRTPLVVFGDGERSFVNASVYAAFGAEAPLASVPLSPDTRTILGPRYAPLRALPPVEPGGRDANGQTRVALAVGAYASRDAVSAVIRDLGERDESIVWYAVGATPESPKADGGIEPADAAAGTMQRADLYVGSSGWTALEAARLGIPALYLEPEDRHARRRLAMVEAGLGWAAPAGDPDLTRRMFARLRTDTRVRDAMSAAGRRLVDGHGAARVLEKLSRYTGLPVKIPDIAG